jgi:3-oxoacyl-[acyl-carrier-protein] synthase II
MKHRVVITGVGAVTPLGNSFSEIADSLFTGKSGIAHDEHLGVDVAHINMDVDAQYDNFDIQVTDRLSRTAYIAYQQAKANSGVDQVDGVYFGTGAGSATEVAKTHRDFAARGKLRPTSLVSVMSNNAANFIATKEQITGPVFTYSAACSSASVAIGEAYRAVAYGDAEVMTAGGGEFCISKILVEQWRAMKALSNQCRPFSASRDGINLSEGTVMYILETLERAQARGAHIYGEIVGYGVSCGAETMTKPNEQGQISALTMAIKDIDPSRITYINAHGTGTPVGDLTELSSIEHVLGNVTPRIPISSTKALHGHLLGAAGAMELAACLAVLDRNQVIPNWVLTDPDPAISPNINLPTTVVNMQQDVCLNNSFAFGGTNIVLAIARFDNK